MFACQSEGDKKNCISANFEGFEYVFPHRAGEDFVSIRDKQ
jgi:hypothetical protein